MSILSPPSALPVKLFPTALLYGVFYTVFVLFIRKCVRSQTQGEGDRPRVGLVTYGAAITLFTLTTIHAVFMILEVLQIHYSQDTVAVLRQTMLLSSTLVIIRYAWLVRHPVPSYQANIFMALIFVTLIFVTFFCHAIGCVSVVWQLPDTTPLILELTSTALSTCISTAASMMILRRYRNLRIQHQATKYSWSNASFLMLALEAGVDCIVIRITDLVLVVIVAATKTSFVHADVIHSAEVPLIAILSTLSLTLCASGNAYVLKLQFTKPISARPPSNTLSFVLPALSFRESVAGTNSRRESLVKTMPKLMFKTHHRQSSNPPLMIHIAKTVEYNTELHLPSAGQSSDIGRGVTDVACGPPF